MNDKLSAYFDLMKSRPEEFENNSSFTQIIKDPEIIEEYCSKTGKEIGLFYKSDYHIMVVDLVTDDGITFYPYERLLTTIPKGAVVGVAIYNGRYVLLKQYRHSLRDFQFAFPRGYAEDGLSAEQNIRKELFEELGCQVSKSEYLGSVVADSGVCGQKVSVFRCMITEPVLKRNYEGIEQIYMFTSNELQQMIRDGKISDGYTLAAFGLLFCNCRGE